MRAAIGGQTKSIGILNEFGANLAAADKKGRNALHLAVEVSEIESVRCLLEIASKIGPGKPAVPPTKLIESADKEGSKPLHTAAGLGNITLVNVLIGSGANLEAIDSLGRTPLHLAVTKCQDRAVATLLGQGSNIEARDANLETPLISAVKANALGSIKLLLDQGAARDAVDVQGDSPIHHGARLGHVNGIEMIYTELGHLERPNNIGERPLHLACAGNHLRMARALLRSGVELNPWTTPPASNGSGQKMATKHARSGLLPTATILPSTPLHYACSYADYDVVGLLVDRGAWVNADQEGGLSPLMLAAETGKVVVASLLLEAGAKVNAATSGECITALHIACRKNDLDMAKLLVRHGADTEAQTKGLETPTAYGLAVAGKDAASRKTADYIIQLNFSNAHSTAATAAPTRSPLLTSLVPDSPAFNVHEYQGYFQPPPTPASAAGFPVAAPEEDLKSRFG
jgi:ankyrin repeat protein